MTQKLDNKKMPYVAPTIEVDEYLVEEGFATSHIYNDTEMLEFTGEDGQNEVGGSWLDLDV